VRASVADLLAPRGLVESSLFPGEDAATLEARLQAYIDEGERNTGVEDAVKAWAYYRAFYAAYVRLTSQPSTRRFDDQGQSSYLVTQIQNVLAEAERWKAVYDGLVSPVVEVRPASGTHSVDNTYSW
jgi:hypothetical protein